MNKLIRIIAAIQDKDNGIAFEGDLIYKNREDLKRFMNLTKKSGVMIMGRKTFETFPNPLKGRTHYVATRDPEKKFAGAIAVNSIESGLRKANHFETIDIIGGGEIYKKSIDFAHIMELTRFKGNQKADVFFPDLKKSKFYMTHKSKWGKDPDTGVPFRYEKWKRKKPTLKERWNMLFRKYE